MNEALSVEDLTVRYRGGAIGAAGIALRVVTGQVHALVGPNGAGKTSTLRGIAGFLERESGRAASGSVRLFGDEVGGKSPLVRSHLGLTLVPSDRKVFADLSVAENLRAGGYGVRGPVFRRQYELAMSVFPALKDRADARASLLSGGQRQMLALASALCTNPSVLLVDELTQGLATEVIDELIKSLRMLMQEGLAMLLAEENLTVIRELADTMYVLEGGQMVWSGEPTNFLSGAAGESHIGQAELT